MIVTVAADFPVRPASLTSPALQPAGRWPAQRSRFGGKSRQGPPAPPHRLLRPGLPRTGWEQRLTDPFRGKGQLRPRPGPCRLARTARHVLVCGQPRDDEAQARPGQDQGHWVSVLQLAASTRGTGWGFRARWPTSWAGQAPLAATRKCALRESAAGCRRLRKPAATASCPGGAVCFPRSVPCCRVRHARCAAQRKHIRGHPPQLVLERVRCLDSQSPSRSPRPLCLLAAFCPFPQKPDV